MRANFISFRDIREICTIYVWSDNVSIMRDSNTDDITRELFRFFKHNFQEQLKIIKGSDFVFESVELMDYKLHRVRLKRDRSCIKSPKWRITSNHHGDFYCLNCLHSYRTNNKLKKI